MATNKKQSEEIGKNPLKLSGHQKVVEFMGNLNHPLKKEIEVVRKIILSANIQLTEHIKWNAPSFCINNEDRITLNLQGKGYFRLIFHCGAKVKDSKKEGHLFDDTTGLLDWVTCDRAIVKITEMSDLIAKKDRLVEVITKWIDVTGNIEK
ncbi:DUF1801 domain-containing protein [Cytobacillus dafuensis]|uniref:DUF1801 domain-containing protein n=1 Tax=Cytobacillus dafuensis TaxID=1742359 RepID=A0A5B8Z7J6_CYTDA|nr:DUF1801 domain-containing protein [Cytobacillus dafuensis]QED47629.1 DUF1801 domain-containing protein [Cytobacillus dafuensis]